MEDGKQLLDATSPDRTSNTKPPYASETWREDRLHIHIRGETHRPFTQDRRGVNILHVMEDDTMQEQI